MKNKIRSFEEVCKITKKLQEKGKKIVLVHGFFDILHRGHVSLLVEAKKLGDILVVGVDHDDNVKILKGPNRPINDYKSRMFMLSYLEPVNYVFLIEPFKSKNKAFEFFNQLYQMLKPDIIASFTKHNGFQESKKTQAKNIGVQYVNAGELYNKGSSEIIKLLELE